MSLTIKGITTPITALIFDFDGIILESVDIKTTAFKELFNKHPEHIAAIERYHVDNMGVSRYVKFEWIYKNLLKMNLSAAEKNNLDAAFSTIIMEKMLKCPFVAGVQEFIEYTYSRCLNFVVSGTPQKELEMIIEERKIQEWFTGIYGSPPLKESTYKHILETYNLNPSGVVAIGDSNTDYNAAEKVHIAFIGREAKTADNMFPNAVLKINNFMNFGKFIS